MPNPLTTAELARNLGIKPESIRRRVYATGHYFDLRPIKAHNGRLLWPSDAIERLLKGEVDHKEDEDSGEAA